MSPYWQLKFGGDTCVFGKFVNHCDNFCPITYAGYWKIPNLTCWQVSNLFHQDGEHCGCVTRACDGHGRLSM